MNATLAVEHPFSEGGTWNSQIEQVPYVFFSQIMHREEEVSYYEVPSVQSYLKIAMLIDGWSEYAS